MMHKEQETARKEPWQSNEKLLNEINSNLQDIKNKPVYMGGDYDKEAHSIVQMYETSNKLIREHKILSKLG